MKKVIVFMAILMVALQVQCSSDKKVNNERKINVETVKDASSWAKKKIPGIVIKESEGKGEAGEYYINYIRNLSDIDIGSFGYQHKYSKRKYLFLNIECRDAKINCTNPSIISPFIDSFLNALDFHAVSY
ncbi:hypothetical protein, partial [Thermodesulfovibrio sp. N1]